MSVRRAAGRLELADPIVATRRTARFRSPSAWLATCLPATLLTIRLLVLVNVVVLGVVGALYLVFAAPPGGPIAAVVIWAFAAVVLCLLPATKTPRDA